MTNIRISQAMQICFISSFNSLETILLAAQTRFDEHDDHDVYISD